MRALLLLCGVAALLAGLVGGLQRLGVLPVVATASLLALHGPLMVCGLFGTLIGLERAVALRRSWTFASPVLTAAGTAVVFASPGAGVLLIVAGGAGLVASTTLAYRRLPTGFNALLVMAAGLWVAGTLAWGLGADLGRALPAWQAFLLLTIAAERLELTRLQPQTRGRQVSFAAAVAVLLVALLMPPPMGAALFALAQLLLAAWFARYDIARRTVRLKGATRFIAAALLHGYAWLAVAGIAGLARLWTFWPMAGDATLHAMLVGFVFSMVFGHALIVVPAVTGRAVPYHPVFYLPLALLGLSLALRVAGDLLTAMPLRQVGGAGNALAIAVFGGIVLRQTARKPK